MTLQQALLNEEENLLVINRLHQVLRPFMLRRMKEKVRDCCSEYKVPKPFINETTSSKFLSSFRK
jgi:SNF2 family DNA or RNA helicase